MNKRIISLFATTGFLCAAPYVGVKVGVSILKPDVKISGNDVNTTTVTNFPFTYNVSGLGSTAITYGLFGGYSFKINSKISAFVEGDYEYSNKKKSQENLDLSPIETNGLLTESVSVRAKHSFGIMPGVEVSVHEKVALLAGVRLNWTQYEVRANHRQSRTSTNQPNQILALNDKTARSFVMGVEPTLGAKFKFNEKLSARLTVGYNIGQSKKIISSYTNDPSITRFNVTSGVTIKPRSVNVRAAVIYSF